jgi:hypothetical protein
MEQLRNTFSNLALPLFTSAAPDPPKATKAETSGKEWTWAVIHNANSLFDQYRLQNLRSPAITSLQQNHRDDHTTHSTRAIYKLLQSLTQSPQSRPTIVLRQ